MKRLLFTLVIVMSFISAFAQWSSDAGQNNRITVSDQENYSYETKTNKDGITYVCFLTPTKNENSYVYRLQILDKNGNKLLPDSGKIISKEQNISYTMVNQYLMTDNDGNAIISVCDCRNSPSDAENLTYTIYKISPAGEILWDGKGVNLDKGDSHSFEAEMTMATLDDGSYEFAYECDNGDLAQIVINRLSKDGAFLWDKPITLIDKDKTFEYPHLIYTGNNQTVLVYSAGTNENLMARKINADGSSAWASDTKIYRGGFPPVPLQVIMKATAGPDGGVLVSWYDDRDFTGSYSNYISYIKSDGSYGFSTGIEGTKLSNVSNYSCMSPYVIYDDKTKNIYAIWNQMDQTSQENQGIYMQKLSLEGELLWGKEGKAVIPIQNALNYGYASIQKADNDNVAVFYMASSGYGHVQSYLQEYDKDGNTLSNPVPFSTTDSEKSNLATCSLQDNNHWLVSWKEIRDGASVAGIFMQWLNTDGTFGIPTSINNIEEDNKFNATVSGHNVVFDYKTLRDEPVRISIYSVGGQMIASISSENAGAGCQSLRWDASNRENGTYIAVLHTHATTEKIRFYVK